MLIREMTTEDLDEVCRIEQETFSDPWSKKSFLDTMSDENNHYLVVVIDEIIAGYCGYCGVLGEGYIYNVAVKQSFRKQGIGFAMLAELIKQAKSRGISSLTLEVRQSNLPAINLYKRLGFAEAGIRKDFYTKPLENAVIMWLDAIH